MTLRAESRGAESTERATHWLNKVAIYTCKAVSPACIFWSVADYEATICAVSSALRSP